MNGRTLLMALVPVVGLGVVSVANATNLQLTSFMAGEGALDGKPGVRLRPHFERRPSRSDPSDRSGFGQLRKPARRDDHPRDHDAIRPRQLAGGDDFR